MRVEFCSRKRVVSATFCFTNEGKVFFVFVSNMIRFNNYNIKCQSCVLKFRPLSHFVHFQNWPPSKFTLFINCTPPPPPKKKKTLPWDVINDRSLTETGSLLYCNARITFLAGIKINFNLSPRGSTFYLPSRYVPPQKVWVLRSFGLKTGIDFAYFSLN